MKTIKQKIFFGKGIYLLLAQFSLLTILIIKYNWFNQLHVDDGKPFFNLILISLCVTGGIISIKRMLDWGGYKSKIGKILFLYAVGFFAWAIGSSIWIYYYLFLEITLPFPGWSDLAYMLINPAFITAFGLFGYVIALRNQQNQSKQKLYFYIIPICMAIVTFYFIFTFGQGSDFNTDDALELFLNFYYSGGDIITLVVLMLVGGTAFNYLGERLRLPFTLVLSSIVVSYIADTLFAYTTSIGIYLNGDITDFFYALLLFLLSLGVYTLHPHLLDDD